MRPGEPRGGLPQGEACEARVVQCIPGLACAEPRARWTSSSRNMLIAYYEINFMNDMCSPKNHRY